MTPAGLTVRGLTTRAVALPMRRPLGTSVARLAEAPFVLVEIETEEGVTGCAHVFCYLSLAAPMMRRVLAEALEVIRGDALVTEAIARKLAARFALIGTEGVVGMALSALDVACWDAVAKAGNVPLARLLGAEMAPVPAYNSNGLGLADPASLGEEAIALLEEGFGAIKLRLGHTDAALDREAVGRVRAAVPADTTLMVDYNQALIPAGAIARGQELADAGLYWIEEPVRHDDLAGCARIAAALATPVQIGENFNHPNIMQAAIAAQAADYMMPDLMRIGGVSGWLRAAALAAEADIPLSSHLYPEVSAHLLAASPTGHWLEYVDWAEPVLAEPLTISDGQAIIPDRPGTGVAFDASAAARYALY